MLSINQSDYYLLHVCRRNLKKDNMMQSQKLTTKTSSNIISPSKVPSDSSSSVTSTPKSSVSSAVSENQKFQTGGASIVYVHTFCAELLGEASSLELCRSEMKQKCEIDVLSWFKLSPSESQDMLSKLFKNTVLELIQFHP